MTNALQDYSEEIKFTLDKAVDLNIALGRVIRMGNIEDCPTALQEINDRINQHLTTLMELLAGNNEGPDGKPVKLPTKPLSDGGPNHA